MWYDQQKCCQFLISTRLLSFVIEMRWKSHDIIQATRKFPVVVCLTKSRFYSSHFVFNSQYRQLISNILETCSFWTFIVFGKGNGEESGVKRNEKQARFEKYLQVERSTILRPHIIKNTIHTITSKTSFRTSPLPKSVGPTLIWSWMCCYPEVVPGGLGNLRQIP